ncbi:SKI family transcriptional corepressor 2 [Triticum aestivum]|uniref:SKI family transcriptional corepressor 2 n=1 Tax=Triticum aestivum TaxID=4565 RepID=UPI001D01A0EB|nr:SKI family transcriptional corepressor 2-like [Triticum aestivum]
MEAVVARIGAGGCRGARARRWRRLQGPGEVDERGRPSARSRPPPRRRRLALPPPRRWRRPQGPGEALAEAAGSRGRRGLDGTAGRAWAGAGADGAASRGAEAQVAASADGAAANRARTAQGPRSARQTGVGGPGARGVVLLADFDDSFSRAVARMAWGLGRRENGAGAVAARAGGLTPASGPRPWPRGRVGDGG